MLIINNWIGRNGNNVLQVIRAIHYAILNNHNLICFNKHRLFCNTRIELIVNKNNNEKIVDTFFNLKKFDIDDPQPYQMKQYFNKYIKKIFIIEIKPKEDVTDYKTLYIHFRGGDIFSNNPHSAYVQPPLSYYEDIVSKFDSVKLICEDNKNPCINVLLKENRIEYISNTLENDLIMLSNVSNLVIGFGTFGFLLYLMNPYLKNLFIPSYFVDELPVGSWGDSDINVHIIDVPNYIKVGEWKNTKEQRNFMLSYKK